MNRIHSPHMPGVLVAAALAAILAGPAVPQEQPTSSVRESVQVREVEVMFDRPTGLRWMGSKFTPDRMQVTEGGQPRTVTRVEPLLDGSAQGAWRVVICLDRRLASRETLNKAVAMLVAQSSRLVRLGEVEVLEADPVPRQVQGPTRDPRVLEAALQDAVRLGDARESGTPADEAAFERQLDRVVNAVSPDRATLPSALIWVTDPWPLPDPVEFWAMKGVDAMREKAPEDASGAARLADIGRMLAAERWTVAVVAPGAGDVETHQKKKPIGEVSQTQTPDGRHQRTVVMWNINQLLARMFGWKTSPYDQQAAVTAAEERLDPELAPMQLLAGATQGRLVRSDSQMQDFAAALANRWHLFYTAPRDGRATPTPVEVGIVEDGIEFSLARTWRAGAEPAAQTRSRLRQALADGSKSLSSNLEHLNCRLEVAAEDDFRLQCTPDNSGTEAGRLRVSFATEGCAGTEAVRIQEAGHEPGAAGNEPWQFSVPECARRLAVAIEDPMNGRGLFWAGAVPSTTVILP